MVLEAAKSAGVAVLTLSEPQDAIFIVTHLRMIVLTVDTVTHFCRHLTVSCLSPTLVGTIVLRKIPRLGNLLL